jgi:cysteine desulfurase/selenocysteine lyase
LAPDWTRIRADFPILSETVNGHSIVYLDNAASSQMPRSVIDRIMHYQSHEHANIHRGVHHLSQTATLAYERTRETIASFLGAAEPRECIFVRGATEGINLVVHSYGRRFLQEGDEVILSALEHHANIVPWQMLRDERGIVLRVVPMLDDGTLDFDAYRELFNERTKFVSLVHVSNALGTVVPVKDYISLAHGHGVPVMIDGCQAVPHGPVDVQELDADFYVFSGHKLFGPTGAGVLYGKAALLETMAPFQGGGDMIEEVTFEKTTYAGIPERFEAGTPAIMPIIALGAAIEYVGGLGFQHVTAREVELSDYALKHLLTIDGLKLWGPTSPAARSSVFSFTLDGAHPHDVGQILDMEGVAVRTGHHCAQPVMARLGITATVRASLAFYNTFEDIDRLVSGLATVQDVLGLSTEGTR